MMSSLGIEIQITLFVCAVSFLLCSFIYVVQSFAFGSTKSQREEELKLLEEETARRIEEAIRKNVEEKLNSEEAKLEIERRVAEGVKKLFDDVEVQLEKEKQDALTEARRKEVSIL
jgi:DNA primase large subunit